MNKKLIAALQCAVRVMDGTAGGYSPTEIMEAKVELMNWIVELERKPE